VDCWASSLGDCAGGQSREHYISDGIFDGEVVTAFGLPWCKDQPKSIGLAQAASKILCRHHNQALSAYDAEAAKLSRFLSANVLVQPLAIDQITLDGRRLEKWALKTLINLGYIGALDPQAHSQLKPRRDIIDWLFRDTAVADGIGLYFLSGSINNENFTTGLSWNVINNRENGNILGMSFSFNGVRFIANLVPVRAEEKIASMGEVNGVDYSKAKTYYRPTNIVLGSSTAGRKTITLKW
jgi:hypothetical protein